ncbi:hypothetical protein ACW9YV_07500 [Paraburkholderia strydomiana]
MMEYFSPAVLAAILRVSSSPIFSARLAMVSLLVRRDASRHEVGTVERARAMGEDATRA